MRTLSTALLPAAAAAVALRRGSPLVDPRTGLEEAGWDDDDIVLDEHKWWRLPRQAYKPGDPRPYPPTDDYHSEGVRNASKVAVLIASLDETKVIATLKTMFERAQVPSRVYAGVVQQNSERTRDALEGLCEELGTPLELKEQFRGRVDLNRRQKDEDAWGHSRYTPESFAACGPASRVRMYRMTMQEAKGPAYARGRQPILLGDGGELEDFCMQIDIDTVFTPGWDDKAMRQWTEMDNEYVVLSAVDSEDPMVTSQYVLPRPGNTASSWVQEAAERGSVPVIVPGNGHDGSCHTRWRSAFRDRLELVVQSSTHPVESDNELAEPPRLRLHVSSIGGVGTTSMMHELNRLNPPIATNHHSDLDRIKHIPFGDKIRKSAPDKILYIYGDPVHAVISLDRRGWFHHQAMKVRSDPWPTGLSKATGMTNLSQWLDDPGDDFLQLERHFGSFYHQCEFPVAFLLINEKTEHLDELAAFLETDKTQVARVLHEWKPERITADTHPEPSTLDYDGLKDRIAEKLKGIISKFKALPGFTTVIPGKDC